jgi:hypothetical protein
MSHEKEPNSLLVAKCGNTVSQSCTNFHTNSTSFSGHTPPSDVSQSSTSSSLAPATHMKEEASDDGAVSPPPQTETVPLLIGAGSDPLQQQQRKATSNMSHTQPRTETRKTGTCYFCKKAFMKNKQVKAISISYKRFKLWLFDDDIMYGV